MSDRIAVFHDGQGDAAGYAGHALQPAARRVRGRASSAKTTCSRAPSRRLLMAMCASRSPAAFGCIATAVGQTGSVGAPVVVAVRPEAIASGRIERCSGGQSLPRVGDAAGSISAIISGCSPTVDNGHTITVKVPAGTEVATGAAVFLSWATADCRAFPASAAAAALSKNPEQASGGPHEDHRLSSASSHWRPDCSQRRRRRAGSN